MSKLLRRVWQSDVTSGVPRRDRASCEYKAYVPDELVDRAFTLAGEVAADVVDAETTLARFDAEAATLVNTEALGRILVRAESVASSRIEGLEIGARRLLRAEVAMGLGESGEDVTATEVLNNIHAMTWAMDTIHSGDDITLESLLEAHRRLLAGTRIEAYGGVIRKEQNWIGGSSFHPCSAVFVPAPPENVPGLLDDLCAFCNDDHLPAVAQAAIAHAQFETIHPFVDGNGRIGRALIHLVLRRRGLATRATPPISLILATWSDDYVRGLTATRYVGEPQSGRAVAGVNDWVGLFATACRRAVEDASGFERRIEGLQRRWRSDLGRVRRDSAIDLLLSTLPGTPIVTVKGASELIGRTFQATNEAIARLVDAGILKQVNVARRNRAFEAPELIRLFTELERQLASPEGDTRSSAPARPVPYRR